jgi:hypothetical protein
MAMCIQSVCQHCGYSVQAWDEGDPYYFDESGSKRYAYHPSRERELCIGIDSPHLCLNCGDIFPVDSRAPITTCPKCSSHEIADTFDLEGQVCPACKRGVFRRDSRVYGIS